MGSEDLISFDVIESQKENIQALPSGRSAKKLAELFSPSRPFENLTPTPSGAKSVNDCIRAEYEAELANISEADDPLDVYDRYVRWTLDTYPSAQATPQSQLLPLLERATRAFVGNAQYRSDPRYLKLWLHYIHFFADAPRETFIYLARHGIGETLALFYEEYAAWLESAGRWAQAEEVYKLGIERNARPTQRLLRKFGEFEQRRAACGERGIQTPSSPALPAVRPALAAKVDPFAAAVEARDPQAPHPNHGIGGQSSKPAKSKLTVFSDADAAPPALFRDAGSKGWESIGSLADRKKENVAEPRPWVGETLKAGGKRSTAPKMMVFRDTSQSKPQSLSPSHVVGQKPHQLIVYARNGKNERTFVDLSVVYPNLQEAGTELSFEEVWAANRGWLDRSWDEDNTTDLKPSRKDKSRALEVDRLAETVSEKLVVHHHAVMLDENGAPIGPPEGKPRKKKIMEINETQIIKAKLDSPSRPKLRKRNATEPTMTIHTKAATDDIYEIFNQPFKATHGEDSVEEDGYETDDYTSGAESTGTTRNITTSEMGDGEVIEDEVDEEASDVKSVSEWSEFTARKHIPNVMNREGAEDGLNEPADITRSSGRAEALDGDFSDVASEPPDIQVLPGEDVEDAGDDEVLTPVSESFLSKTRTSFIPIPPEDYVPPTRPYRDPAEVANNRLPFMTPITERTESSLDIETEENNVHTRTPSRRDDRDITIPDQHEEEDSIDLEPLSSPLREIVNEELSRTKVTQPFLQRSKPAPGKSLAMTKAVPKSPIIKEIQCNPMDDVIRAEILEKMHPPLSSYGGFYDHRDETFEKGPEIRRFVKALKNSRHSTDRTGPIGTSVLIQFPDTATEYTVKKELGAGAFAPVYLVENSTASASREENDENKPVAMGRGAFACPHHRRKPLEAVKMEYPPTAWEFHIMRLAHSRLGPHHRATSSLSAALEMHLYRDEGFLFLPYQPHGTLLDVVNLFRAESSGVMDELLAMFFTIELFRTVEALHSKQILHGDLKPDNCLLRLDHLGHRKQQGAHPQGDESDSDGSHELAAQWSRTGAGGWASRGVTLIDFGRGIDMRCFSPDVKFIADWKTTAQDCTEMREGRPWTWQVDYHGLAGVVHCLLFGKYIETVRADIGNPSPGDHGTAILGGGGRKYRVRETLKRYWQTEIWTECFNVLLNPVGFVEAEEGQRMPVLRSMRRVRERMEDWLEANCERGVGLRGLMMKVEAWAKGRR
ncbi:hypothetical protein VTK73DRAFT_4455 [Phialemonium thermophilum]|uniref:Uncharacterized protein n=1 Tax=Phialemonium thermophilum TaxID=223376 RepID=A0ABR3WTM7_9PEZI